jgi:flagellar assembly protein FliH
MVRSRSDDLDKKVNTIIEQARGDCKNILKIKTEEGFAEGMKVAEARYAEFDDYFENLKNKITDECKNDNKVIEENILDIAFILARRIIDIQLERSDTAILSALKDVVGKFKEENGISIDVSENVAKRLKKDEYKQLYKVNVNKELSDEEILLNSNFGIVEASIDTQLDNLKKALLEECKKI